MSYFLCKYKYYSLILVLMCLFFCQSSLLAQYRSPIYDAYIDKFSPTAIAHQTKYGIPASIKLAQGLLESGAGNSQLARRSNNHFGIKCHRSWSGKRVYAADDLPNDCFRKYDRPEESYVDHSEFLKAGPRYRFLFDLAITDYKGWARGLQKSGYATDKAYANKLIKLIEDYELFRFDDEKYRPGVSQRQRKVKRQAEVANHTWRHQPYKTHGLIYIVAVEGDTFVGIADEFGFNESDLLAYNEVPADFPLSEGDIVYFQKKKPRADKPYYDHVVQVGESMYSISQKYGIQMRNLYRLNKKDYEYIPEEGDVLKLR